MFVNKCSSYVLLNKLYICKNKMKIKKRQPIFLSHCQKFCEDPQNELLKKDIETWMEEHREITGQLVILPIKEGIPRIPILAIPCLIRRIQSGRDVEACEEELLALADELSRRVTE